MTRNWLNCLAIGKCMLVLALTCSVGCTLTVHSPMTRLHKLMLDSSNQQYDDSTGHMVFLMKLPGLTYTYVSNETLGIGKYGKSHFLFADAFDIPSARGRSLTFRFLTDGNRCRIADSEYDAIERATRTAFSKISDKFIPSGSVDIVLLRDGPYFVNRTYSLRFGTSIQLALFFPCEDGIEEVTNFSAILTSLHELTHIIYRLHSGIPGGTSPEEEIVADYAPACIYEDFDESDSSKSLRLRFPADAYYRGSIYGKEAAQIPTELACRVWIHTIQSFIY